MNTPANEPQVKTLIDLIQASRSPESAGITFINSEVDHEFLSYAALYENAARLLSTLQLYGLQPGSELVLQIDDNQTFLYYFWACILGAIIPVPVSAGNKPTDCQKLFAVWKALTNPHLVTDRKHWTRLQEFGAEHQLQSTVEQITNQVILGEEVRPGSGEGTLYPARPDDIAYIQFTSGATGAPKGVILTHANLVSTANAIYERSEMTPADLLMSWMPLTHDMGLNGCHLVPLRGKYNQYIIPTSLFIRRPSLWMRMAAMYRISILASSNFGLKYFLTSAGSETPENLDLSRVRLIFTGAEPIQENLCHSFLSHLQPSHLKKNVIFTVYGMAEAGLAVTFPTAGEQFISVKIDRASLNMGQTVKKLSPANNGLALVDLGYPVPGCSVRICDSKNQVLDESKVGYIQIKGRNVTPGYYHQPDIDRVAFTADGWLNTGDLGYMEQGRLVVIGRSAERILIKGHLYFSHDIEQQVEDFKGLEILEAAACGVSGRELEAEHLLLFILYKRSCLEFAPLALQINQQLNRRLRIQANEIIPVKKIPRTTSGKIQRFKLTEAFLRGEYEPTIREVNHFIRQMNINAEPSLTQLPSNGALIYAN